MKTLALCGIVGGVLLFPAPLPAQPYRFSTAAGLAGAGGSADGTSTTARFWAPYGIAAGSNALFVADTGNHTIRKLTFTNNNWVVSTVAGLAGTKGTADGTNANARFYYPFGVAVDSLGRLYVADTYNYTIRRIVPVGTNWAVNTIAGLAGVQGTANGSNSVARFTYLQGLAVDSATNLYVTDGSAIRKVSPVGTNWAVTTLAGVVGTSGSADGTNAAALFYYPFGIAVDRARNLYVADQGNDTIRKVSPFGANWVVSTIAGLPGGSGSTDAANSAARFYFPAGVALDSATNLYVTDYGNQTVRKLSPAGANWIASTLGGAAGLAGSVDGTNGTARFNYPLGIAADSTGNNLYVADTDNDTLRQGLNLMTLTCDPPPTNLLAWWRAEGNANDSADSYNATLVNGASFAAGEVGLGFSLSGGGDYVALPQNIFPYPTKGSGTSPFTFEVWFSTTVGGMILGQQSTSSPTGSYVPALYVGVDGLLYAALFWNNFTRLVSSTTVNDGQFHHVAVTFDGATEVLYLDGVPIVSTPFTQQAYAANYQYQLGTGYAAGWPGTDNYGWFYFNGIIDEASIYTRALTAVEVAAIFNAGSSGKCTAGTGTAPLITAQPTSLAVPLASTATFQVSATGTEPMTYTWCKEGCALTEGGNLSCPYASALSVANVGSNDEGGYSVIISNPRGCVTSALATLKVLMPPVITAQPQSCAPLVGTKAVFSATASGAPPLSYRWQFNGADLANGQGVRGTDTPTLTLNHVDVPNAGYYRLVATNAGGVVTSTVAFLQVVLTNGQVVSPPVPRLSIGSAAGRVRLSWPADGSAGFQLQLRGVSAAQWQNATNEPVLANGLYQVTLPATDSATLYRLKQ